MGVKVIGVQQVSGDPKGFANYIELPSGNMQVNYKAHSNVKEDLKGTLDLDVEASKEPAERQSVTLEVDKRTIEFRPFVWDNNARRRIYVPDMLVGVPRSSNEEPATMSSAEAFAFIKQNRK